MVPFVGLDAVSGLLAVKTAEIALRTFLRYATEKSWDLWDCNIEHVNSAWTKVYAEIEEVGLGYEPADEEDGGYLHQIRLEVAWLPSLQGEVGYVFEETTWMSYLTGYEEGVIYLPSNKSNRVYVPGAGLADVIRHEYAHAWHWLEPEFFETGWFERAFRAAYEDGSNAPYLQWWSELAENRGFQRDYARARTTRDKTRLIERACASEFVSWYAATQPCEDFAETFMTYLRYRNNLDKFRSRGGVYRKLKAVEKAVAQAKRELGLS